MTASELLAQLTAEGFRLRAAGDRLWVTPAARLTPTLRALLAQHRPALCALLASAGDPRPERRPGSTPAEAPALSVGRHYDGPTPPCPRCGGPTHDALDHWPGIVVLLCDDAERCRWGLTLSPAELNRWLAGAGPPPHPPAPAPAAAPTAPEPTAAGAGLRCCPTCGGGLIRQGTRTIAGKARFLCPSCDDLVWLPAADLPPADLPPEPPWPTRPCYACGSYRFWLRRAGACADWLCAVCHPPPWPARNPKGGC